MRIVCEPKVFNNVSTKEAYDKWKEEYESYLPKINNKLGKQHYLCGN